MSFSVCILRSFLRMNKKHHEQFPAKYSAGIPFASATFFAFNHTCAVDTPSPPAHWTSTQSASSASSSSQYSLHPRNNFWELFAVDKGTHCALHFLTIDSLMPSCYTDFLLPTSSASLIASHLNCVMYAISLRVQGSKLRKKSCALQSWK